MELRTIDATDPDAARALAALEAFNGMDARWRRRLALLQATAADPRTGFVPLMRAFELGEADVVASIETMEAIAGRCRAGRIRDQIDADIQTARRTLQWLRGLQAEYRAKTFEFMSELRRRLEAPAADDDPADDWKRGGTSS